MSPTICRGVYALAITGAWLSAVTGAFAQSRPVHWLVEVIGGPVSSNNPSVQIRLSAAFSPLEYAFANAAISVTATEQGWSQPRLNGPIFLGTPGIVAGAQVTGIDGYQTFVPLTIYPSRDNPIAFWEATWSTNDFRPRMVEVRTATTRFDVYPFMTTWLTESRLHELTEGSAFIQVIPTPATTALLGVSAVFVLRRRR